MLLPHLPSVVNSCESLAAFDVLKLAESLQFIWQRISAKSKVSNDWKLLQRTFECQADICYCITSLNFLDLGCSDSGDNT